MTQLVINKMISSDDAVANIVIVSSEMQSMAKGSSFLKVSLPEDPKRFFVSTVEFRPQTDGILLNAFQRERLGCKFNDVVNVEFLASSSVSEAYSITFTLEHFVKRPMVVDEKLLCDTVVAACQNRGISENGVLIVSYNSCYMSLIATEISCLDSKNGSADVQRAGFAYITSNTIIDINPTTNPLLDFKKGAKKDRTKLIRSDWKFENMGIGGLDGKFTDLFRRVFVSRLLPLDFQKRLDVKHVKGILLYGPPGTGKTLIARKIGSMLNSVEPKVINGPEILNKFVGQSEENLRSKFEDAEKDYAENGDDAELHVIIFDEIDAICKVRGSGRSSTGVGDNLVNQFLTKIDGVNTPPNILVIGMTNRKDLLDPALLRPGRLEVHLEINLPDHAGRIQILNIHTKHLRENNILAADVDFSVIADKTKNFSGAEIQGLVGATLSKAMSSAVVEKGDGGVVLTDDYKNFKITMSDFIESIKSITPVYGVDEDDLRVLCRGPMVNFSVGMMDARERLEKLINDINNPTFNRSISRILVHGATGSGLSSIVSKAALDANFPFVKLISASKLQSSSEYDIVNEMNAIFRQAYDSPLSLIIIDQIEEIISYFAVGPRFSTVILSRLYVLISQPPPNPDHKLVIVANTGLYDALDDLRLSNVFNYEIRLPMVCSTKEVRVVENKLGLGHTYTGSLPIPIKKLMSELMDLGSTQYLRSTH